MSLSTLALRLDLSPLTSSLSPLPSLYLPSKRGQKEQRDDMYVFHMNQHVLTPHAFCYIIPYCESGNYIVTYIYLGAHKSVFADGLELEI